VFVAITQISAIRRWLSAPSMAALGRLSFPLYLTHWPILFGLTSYLFLTFEPALGLDPSRILACVIGIAVAFGVAMLFRPIDVWSTRLAQRIRA
jgi:peptidoglycan/LPS O-acetylase OafA/YrhL